MRVGNFSLLIPNGQERDNGHVFVEHGKQFTIRLGNHNTLRCDAHLFVDGKETGVFRLHGYETLSIEGPPDGDRGKFTAFTTDSGEAAASDVANIANAKRGLIEVQFKPEKVRPPVKMPMVPGPYEKGNPWVRPMPDAVSWEATLTSEGGPRGQSMSSSNLEGVLRSRSCAAAPETQAVITGLTGQNDQKWSGADRIEYDPNGEVTITLRLVQPIGGVPQLPDVRPLRAANRVPDVASRS